MAEDIISNTCFQDNHESCGDPVCECECHPWQRKLEQIQKQLSVLQDKVESLYDAIKHGDEKHHDVGDREALLLGPT